MVTGPSRRGGRVLEEEAPRTERRRWSPGTPPTSHTVPAEGGFKPRACAFCLLRCGQAALLPGLLSGGAQDSRQRGRLLRGHRARNCRWRGPCGGQGGAMRALAEPALVGPLVCPGRLSGGGDMGAAAVGMGKQRVCVCVCGAGQHLPGGGCGPREVVQSGSQSRARACGPGTSLELFGGQGWGWGGPFRMDHQAGVRGSQPTGVCSRGPDSTPVGGM